MGDLVNRDEMLKLTSTSSSTPRTSFTASRKCLEFFTWVLVFPPRGDMRDVMNLERR